MELRVAGLICLLTFLCLHFWVRKRSIMIRISCVVAVSAVLLPLPIVLDLPQAQGSTVMASVVCFSVSLKLAEIMLLTPKASRLNLTFWQFCYEFLYFGLFIRKRSERMPKRSLKQLICNFIILFCTGIIKIIVGLIIFDYLHPCIANGERAAQRQLKMDEDYLLLIYYNSISAITIVTTVWFYDFLEGIVPLVTMDKYQYGPFCNWVGLSSSVTDLWGKRYNLLISEFLKTSVFQPMKRIFNASNSVAAISSFIMSGILHVYVIAVTFGTGYKLIWTFLFFLIHGIACTIDVAIHQRTKQKWIFPPIISISVTLSFIAVTLPLYSRPMLAPSMIILTAPNSLLPYLPRLHEFMNVEAYCLG